MNDFSPSIFYECIPAGSDHVPGSGTTICIVLQPFYWQETSDN
ncbi:MAG: hypothetical protein ACFFD4_20680 [Candidatus Odinarchaeota archaeon]